MKLQRTPFCVTAALVGVCMALACESGTSGGQTDSDASTTSDIGTTHDGSAPFDSTTTDDATTTPDSGTDADPCDGQSVGEKCSQNGECCGYPSVAGCFSGICAARCERKSDCPSGCCYWVGAPQGVCMPAKDWCLPATPGPDPTSLDTVSGFPGTGCKKLPGDACNDNMECCGDSDPPISFCFSVHDVGLHCVARCTAGADCRSGCCFTINTIYRVCVPYDPYCL